MKEVLAVRDMQVRYPTSGGLAALMAGKRATSIDVVCGVSFAVAPGDTLAIVGESGSGKTTLAMGLSGLVPVSGGDVVLDGNAVAMNSKGFLQPDRRRISVMLQDPVGSLSPRMTVQRLLAEPFRIDPELADDPDAAALRLLDRVGLSREFAGRYPHQLSGGQARRVGLARALAQKPGLLIADEPTAGLDVSIQGEMLNLLAEVQRDMGLGIIMITHNLNIVRHAATDMAIMYLGRFIEQGLPQRIFERPRHPYTAALLAANPSVNPATAIDRIQLLGEVPSLFERPRGCEFHTRCPRAQDVCLERFPQRQGVANTQVWNCVNPVD